MLKKSEDNVVMDVALMDELEMLYGTGLHSRIKKSKKPPSISISQTTQPNPNSQLSALKQLCSRTLATKNPSPHEKSSQHEKELERKTKQKLHKIIVQH
jgi:hypothetical protein